MERIVLSVPTLFGDHHTTAVRRILEGAQGVSEVYVSAAAKQVAVTFDPEDTDRVLLEAALGEHGYTCGDEELTYPSSLEREPTRHSASVVTAGEGMTFQEIAPSWQGRPLWPCPGLEYQPSIAEELE